MADSYRREHTKEEFVRVMNESPDDVRQTAQDLTRGKRRVEVSARFLYDELQDELNLVQEDGSGRSPAIR